ncbi:uncharacterized protein BDV17DRAFT_185128 [Aspergillus undulatus]|uniref:uncharacterized protein n=1 Tax=Aspergillus undulatus TaxID=1810928 RepID=UPI003CCD7C02
MPPSPHLASRGGLVRGGLSYVIVSARKKARLMGLHVHSLPSYTFMTHSSLTKSSKFCCLLNAAATSSGLCPSLFSCCTSKPRSLSSLNSHTAFSSLRPVSGLSATAWRSVSPLFFVAKISCESSNSPHIIFCGRDIVNFDILAFHLLEVSEKRCCAVVIPGFTVTAAVNEKQMQSLSLRQIVGLQEDDVIFLLRAGRGELYE